MHTYIFGRYASFSSCGKMEIFYTLTTINALQQANCDVYVQVWVYTNTYTCMCIQIHIHVCTSMFIHRHIYMYVYTNAHKHVCTSMCIHRHIYMHCGKIVWRKTGLKFFGLLCCCGCLMTVFVRHGVRWFFRGRTSISKVIFLAQVIAMSCRILSY